MTCTGARRQRVANIANWLTAAGRKVYRSTAMHHYMYLLNLIKKTTSITGGICTSIFI